MRQPTINNSSYYATINWDGNTPINDEFNDPYFCRLSGIEETQYVFIKHNNLHERFAQLKNGGVFNIAETGFGSGLNFLTTLKLWQEIQQLDGSNKDSKLFFISFENKPLHPNDIIKILNTFPQIQQQIEEFLPQYYLILPSVHRMVFKNNVYLDLIIGDINHTLPQQEFIADCWFLDGFAPNKNPDMWHGALIQQIANHSKSQTTFATYTANSNVRRSLIECGFNVNKTRGFTKREMMWGHYNYNNNDNESNNNFQVKTKPNPWYARYHNINNDKHVIVIGGGISGSTTAYNLARRGYRVTIYEKENNLALGSSGNHLAILYGSFAGNQSPILDLSFSGYRYSHNLIRSILRHSTQEFNQCGLIQIPTNTHQKKQQYQILNSNFPPDFCRFVDKNEITNIIGCKLNSIGVHNEQSAGILFPYGICFSPQTLINKLVNNPLITIKINHNIKELIQNKNHLWQVSGLNTSSNIDFVDNAYNVVICNADGINQLSQFTNLPVRKIRGQVSVAPKTSIELNAIVCHDGYITPTYNNKFVIGATFDFKNINTTVTNEDHLENINRLATILPNLALQLNLNQLKGKTSIRLSTTDYMPLVGPIADEMSFKKTYNKLSLDKNYWIDDPCPYLNGLFINVAHGAKGMLTAPISSEIIANYIDNTPMPCNEKLRQAIHPNRLWRNQLIKHN